MISNRTKPLPRSAFESITPKMAEDWLKTMVNNRPPSDSLVYELATSIQDGRWVLNGETIKFNSEGHLFDGQHRLLACMIAGKPFQSYVVRGIEDPRAFSTVDVGKLRTHGDIFAMTGFSDYTIASGIAVFLYNYKNNLLTLRGPKHARLVRNTAMAKALREKLGKNEGARYRSDIDKETLIKFAEPIKDQIVASIRIIKHQKARKLLPVTLLASCHFLFAEKNKFEADQFVDHLTEGVGLMVTDPVYLLRERLISNQALRARTGHKLNRWTQSALVIKAWNKRRAKEKVHNLRIQEDEEFPKVK